MSIVVPFTPGAPQGGEPPAAPPSETNLLVAAAQMHAEGRLIKPTSNQYEYDDELQNAFKGPSPMPDGKITTYNGDDKGIDLFNKLSKDGEAGKYNPGDIIKIPANKNHYNQDLMLQWDPDNGMQPVRSRNKSDVTS